MCRKNKSDIFRKRETVGKWKPVCLDANLHFEATFWQAGNRSCVAVTQTLTWRHNIITSRKVLSSSTLRMAMGADSFHRRVTFPCPKTWWPANGLQASRRALRPMLCATSGAIWTWKRDGLGRHYSHPTHRSGNCERKPKCPELHQQHPDTPCISTHPTAKSHSPTGQRPGSPGSSDAGGACEQQHRVRQPLASDQPRSQPDRARMGFSRPYDPGLATSAKADERAPAWGRLHQSLESHPTSLLPTSGPFHATPMYRRQSRRGWTHQILIKIECSLFITKLSAGIEDNWRWFTALCFFAGAIVLLFNFLDYMWFKWLLLYMYVFVSVVC